MKIRQIDSEHNPTFKTFLKVAKGRGIKRHQLALVSGRKHVEEILRDFPARCEGVLFSGHRSFLTKIRDIEIPLYSLRPDLYRRIDLFDTGHPILLIRARPYNEWDEGALSKGCTLCVPFQDPVNVGAVIRSAAAFGVSEVVILKEAAHPFHPKSIRAAGSQILRVPIYEGPSLQQFNPTGVSVIVLSKEGQDLRGYAFPSRFCLVPGMEGPGLPAHLKKRTCLSILMEPGVDSLNAAVAAGIALYEWKGQISADARVERQGIHR